MPDIKNINVDDVLYDIKDETARTQIGDISTLITTAKEDLVSAINEIAAVTANVIALTQAEYEALVASGEEDPETIYMIVGNTA